MTYTATVRYEADQHDEEGNPVSTEAFSVDFDMQDDLTLEESITYTGDVQFNWTLIEVR